jgi:hypothetical protein
LGFFIYWLWREVYPERSNSGSLVFRSKNLKRKFGFFLFISCSEKFRINPKTCGAIKIKHK